MSVEIVKKAVRLHLATMTPSLPTAYEGMSFDPPSGMYQRLQFTVQRPDDPVIGDKYYRERVQAQIFVNDQAGLGTNTVGTHAELIRQHFPKGLTLIQDGMRIYVLGTPQISGVAVVQNRVICPVLINIVGEVYS